MYRASNWENPHRGRTLKVHCLDGLITTEPRDDEAVHAMIFEAGADAMLRVVRQKVHDDEWDWFIDDTEKEEADGRADSPMGKR